MGAFSWVLIIVIVLSVLRNVTRRTELALTSTIDIRNRHLKDDHQGIRVRFMTTMSISDQPDAPNLVIHGSRSTGTLGYGLKGR
jgi:hypothetical protein